MIVIANDGVYYFAALAAAVILIGLFVLALEAAVARRPKPRRFQR